VARTPVLTSPKTKPWLRARVKRAEAAHSARRRRRKRLGPRGGTSPAGVGGKSVSSGLLAIVALLNATVISDPGALARNLSVGPNGTGMLTIQSGGTLADSFGTVGNLPGGLGTVTVTGLGSNWSNAGGVAVGGLGTGTLTIQDGGTVIGGGGSVGLSAGSIGTVTVSGPGSSWLNGPSGGLNIGSFGTGALMIANGGTVINITNLTANIGNAANSQGTVTVTGPGSVWSNLFGVNIGNSGTSTLTVADGGIVTGHVAIATNAGSIGTLNIGATAGNPAAAPGTLMAPSVAFGAGSGTINFNHTSADYVFAPAISGNDTVNVLAGTTIFTGANTYSGATNVDAGTLRAGALNTFSPNSAVTVASGGTIDLSGFNQTLPGLTNAGLVNMGTSTAPGTVVTTTSYVGTGGTIAMNTFLGSDGSPSDKLVINGGSATGNSLLRITNAGGPGAETVANGIQVVQAINSGTTAPGAFTLAGEVRGGAFDYRLFRGGLGGSGPNDWFLRSSFIVGPSEPSFPLVPLEPGLPTDPPLEPLPPGVYPIIGPEIATYGVVQPLPGNWG
jgi:T5SS/PEP-CTERM-associated repeat protein/autotransporter-associated beta strand protein